MMMQIDDVSTVSGTTALLSAIKSALEAQPPIFSYRSLTKACMIVKTSHRERHFYIVVTSLAWDLAMDPSSLNRNPTSKWILAEELLNNSEATKRHPEGNRMS